MRRSALLLCAGALLALGSCAHPNQVVLPDSPKSPYPDSEEIDRLWRLGGESGPVIDRARDVPIGLDADAREEARRIDRRVPDRAGAVISYDAKPPRVILEEAGNWGSMPPIRKSLFFIEDIHRGARMGVYWKRYNDAEVTLAASLAAVGEFERAKQVAVQTYNHLIERLGRDAPVTRQTIDFLIELYTKWGRYERIFYRRL